MSLQAGCNRECLNSNVDRCVVGWPDGSCGGKSQGKSTPAKEREKQTKLNEGLEKLRTNDVTISE